MTTDQVARPQLSGDGPPPVLTSGAVASETCGHRPAIAVHAVAPYWGATPGAQLGAVAAVLYLHGVVEVTGLVLAATRAPMPDRRGE
jgi:hypothetical protein